METERTELGQLGEFGLIERLAKKVQKFNSKTILGIGDDAAVLDINEKEYLVTTTDMLVEGIHFDLSYVPLKHLGYKAVAVNISDIAAMNAKPVQITVSIAISNRFSLEAIDELYEGINLACQNYKVDLVGGDTTSTRSGLVISITATGLVDKEKIVYRSNAKPNDIICVTGDLGAAYMGLLVLEREKQVFLANPNMEPQLEDKDYLVQKQLKPEARMDIVYELEELGILPTAMIDISDGLASEILHIGKKSYIGAMIFSDKIPIHEITYQTALEFQISPTTVAMNGGEDYELLFTIRQEDFKKIEKHDFITPIGYITEHANGILLRSENNLDVQIQAQGWQHF